MKTIFILFLILIWWNVSAQEKLMPVIPPVEKDSSMIETEEQILNRNLLSGTLYSDGIVTDLEIPKFDIKTVIAQQRYQFFAPKVSNLFESQQFSSGMLGFYPSPFFRNGTILSGATYKLNDKFKLGGFSYGANSIFSAPMPNQGLNNFDTRGATMFLQYKVSDKFKIETRVNVSQGNGSGF